MIADPVLPYLEMMWREDMLHELFVEDVVPALGLAARDLGVTIDDVVYTPGRKCIIQCTLMIDDQPLAALVSMAKDDRLADTYASGSPGEVGAVYVERFRCLVEVFPTDWELTTLPAVTSPELMAPLLAEVGGGVDEWCDPEVLHYRPHRRCVLRYQPRVASGDELIVKVYPPGPKAALAASRMSDLRVQLPAVHLDVPRPLAVNDQFSVLIMEKAAGISMKEALRRAGSTTDAERVIDLAARALADLHTLELDHQTSFRTLEREVARLRNRSKRLKRVAPELVRSIDEAFVRLETIIGGHTGDLVSVCHGDFTLSQLLTDGVRVAMVDFDRTSPGDPALDVGNVMAKLRRDELLTPGLGYDTLAESFLEAYLSYSGPRPGLVDGAQLTGALSLVRGAIRAFRHAPADHVADGSSARALILLDEAHRCLDAL